MNRLLDSQVAVIAIEDQQLAESLAAAIQFGNILHKVSVLAALGGMTLSGVRIIKDICWVLPRGTDIDYVFSLPVT